MFKVWNSAVNNIQKYHEKGHHSRYDCHHILKAYYNQRDNDPHDTPGFLEQIYHHLNLAFKGDKQIRLCQVDSKYPQCSKQINHHLKFRDKNRHEYYSKQWKWYHKCWQEAAMTMIYTLWLCISRGMFNHLSA